MALVLCTGIDGALALSRKIILERAGHTVVLALSKHSVEVSCRKNSFDVAVIGQTLSGREKVCIFATVRRCCPSARVLERYPLHLGRSLTGADDWLDVPVDVPPTLAERVTLLASQNGKLATGSPRKPGLSSSYSISG